MFFACVVALPVILAGCGGSGLTQTSETAHYKVQLTLDGTGFGERTVAIAIDSTAGQPVVADQVVLAPVMREMGMMAPEISAYPVAPGRYEAKGQLFVMTGAWEVDVRVSAAGADEVATFKVEVTQP
jgi:hypothetical protein